MPYNEKPIEKKYFKISEVAKIYKLATSTLRYWETEFEELSPERNSKGVRMFTQHDIHIVGIIYKMLKMEKHNIFYAKKKLKIMFEQSKDKKSKLIWEPGRIIGTVIMPTEIESETDAYYGGKLICEGVLKPEHKNLICATPELLDCLLEAQDQQVYKNEKWQKAIDKAMGRVDFESEKE